MHAGLALTLMLAAGQALPPSEPDWRWMPDGQGDYAVYCGKDFKGWYLGGRGFYRWDGTGYLPVDATTVVIGPATKPAAVGDDGPPRPLRDWIDRRFDERIAASFEEAASDKKTGLGSVIAAAVWKIVAASLHAALVAMLFAAIVSLAWTYWYVPVLFVVVVAVIGYFGGRLGGKRAAT